MAKPFDITNSADDQIDTDDLEYTPKISEAENYHKFLKLVHEGGHSDEENVSQGDWEGYIEDDIIGEMIPAEEDFDSDYCEDYSDLTEAGESTVDIYCMKCVFSCPRSS